MWRDHWGAWRPPQTPLLPWGLPPPDPRALIALSMSHTTCSFGGHAPREQKWTFSLMLVTHRENKNELFVDISHAPRDQKQTFR